MTILETIEKYQFMVAVRTDTPEKAYNAALACIEGGIHLVEITFSVPGAEDVVRELRKDKRVLTGAGTVLSLSDLKKALKAGASYIVSPHLDEKIVKLTKKEGAVSIPGAATPTEIYRAYTAGGDIIKLFPFVEMGGLAFLKAVRAPMPFVRFMLSGGVNLNNVSEYLHAGASCTLIGSAILKKELLAVCDWPSITGLARKFAENIQ
jgi:2-dehydro-3-deoxyphosphogluconate aldolase/(4S)-4-hydroxy-2-oxoglutarate aldolase